MSMQREGPGIDLFKICLCLLVDFEILFPAPAQDLLSPGSLGVYNPPG